MTITPLIITGDRNTGGKRDYSGAFAPEALAFQRMHGGHIRRVDLSRSPAAMRKQVLGIIATERRVHVAVLCHGFVNGLQIGFRNAHVPELAKALAAAGVQRVTLYACSTGGGAGSDGDGGFADRLRDALCAAGSIYCRVDAHSRAGHTTRIPYVRRFEGGGSPVGGTGGTWIVAPGSKLWKPWIRALQKTDLRLRFPGMNASDVHSELLSTRGR